MDWVTNVWNFIRDTVLAESLGVIFGLLVVDRIKNFIQDRRYGNWKIKVISKDKIISDRRLTAKKANQIFQDDTDLAQFLKSESSVFEWLNKHPLDPIYGISTIDHNSRVITINLDKNPEKEPSHQRV